MKLLVTGANGFVGKAVCKRLQSEAVTVVRSIRSSSSRQVDIDATEVGDISSKTDWSDALKNVECVIHLAARVHDMRRASIDQLAEFRRVNTCGTANLAKQAAAAGVKRFVYLSTIKVNGESTEMGRPFSVMNKPAPQDPYGISKYEAEELLRLIAAETGIEVVIIRPTLVYGFGVKGNFSIIMNWLARGMPLPFSTVKNNRRSLVSLDNLVDLIVVCLKHPAAANQTFLISDGEDLSTTDLLRRLGGAMAKPARLFPVPLILLRAGARLLGKGDVAQRLLGNLQVDISHTSKTLGWSPPISVTEGLRRASQGVHE